MSSPVSSAAFRSIMETAGYRIRRPGEVFSFNTPCPEKRGFCFAIWHDDLANGSAAIQGAALKASLRIVGDIPLPTVTLWHLERDYPSDSRLELELSIHGGMTSGWLRQRLAAFGSLIAARIAPDLHQTFGHWIAASQPSPECLAARLMPLAPGSSPLAARSPLFTSDSSHILK